MTQSGERLSIWRRVGYGAGDFGFNFSWQFTALFLLYYYTDVLGLPPATAGAIYMVALIFDAAIDPIIGRVSELTRTPFGRFRPYLIFGAPVLGISIIALTAAPGAFPEHAAIAAGVTHIVFRTLFAFVSIPYGALAARITRDTHIRTDLAALRMMFASLGGIVVSLSANPSVTFLGKGDAQVGWELFCCGLAVLTALFIWVTAFATAGLDPVETATPPVAASHASTHRGALMRIARNRALVVVALSTFVLVFTQAFFQKNIVYWYEYGLGDRAATGLALAIPGAVALICIPLWTWVLKRVAKQNVAILAACIKIAGYLTFLVLGRSSIEGATLGIGLYAVGNAAAIVCLWAMLPDTTEYGEWKTGIRDEGLTVGVVVLMQKAGLGLGVGLLGVALGAIGYVPKAQQSLETLNGLLLIMTLVPICGLMLQMLLLRTYPLTAHQHREMTAMIAAKQNATAGVGCHRPEGGCYSTAGDSL